MRLKYKIVFPQKRGYASLPEGKGSYRSNQLTSKALLLNEERHNEWFCSQDLAAELLCNISMLAAVMLSEDAKRALQDLQETAGILHDNALLVRSSLAAHNSLCKTLERMWTHCRISCLTCMQCALIRQQQSGQSYRRLLRACAWRGGSLEPLAKSALLRKLCLTCLSEPSQQVRPSALPDMHKTTTCTVSTWGIYTQCWACSKP